MLLILTWRSLTNMKPEQLEQILKTIDTRLEAGIEKNVNGKIRILTEEVRNHFIEDKEWKEDYVRADKLMY